MPFESPHRTPAEIAGSDSGQDLAEYAILTALLALVVIGILATVGDQIAEFYERAVGALPFGG